MAHKDHPGQPHDWLWLGPDVRHQPDGTFKEVDVRVCVICLHDSAPTKRIHSGKKADIQCQDTAASVANSILT